MTILVCSVFHSVNACPSVILDFFFCHPCGNLPLTPIEGEDPVSFLFSSAHNANDSGFPITNVGNDRRRSRNDGGRGGNAGFGMHMGRGGSGHQASGGVERIWAMAPAAVARTASF